jgi:hypothetical protein
MRRALFAREQRGGLQVVGMPFQILIFYASLYPDVYYNRPRPQ